MSERPASIGAIAVALGPVPPGTSPLATSGERFRGRSTIQAQRGGHPAERHFTVRRILGDGDLWVSECVITYDGVPTYSLSLMEITNGLVTRETQYFADPFQASPGRAALAEPIPAPDP
jgi:hypothetical protein